MKHRDEVGALAALSHCVIPPTFPCSHAVFASFVEAIARGSNEQEKRRRSCSMLLQPEKEKKNEKKEGRRRRRRRKKKGGDGKSVELHGTITVSSEFT